MAAPRRPRAVSALSGLWLSVFVVDASLEGRGADHRLGALAFALLFGGLVVGELTSARRDADETPAAEEREPVSA